MTVLKLAKLITPTLPNYLKPVIPLKNGTHAEKAIATDVKKPQRHQGPAVF
jgi:hypothetical protein